MSVTALSSLARRSFLVVFVVALLIPVLSAFNAPSSVFASEADDKYTSGNVDDALSGLGGSGSGNSGNSGGGGFQGITNGGNKNSTENGDGGTGYSGSLTPTDAGGIINPALNQKVFNPGDAQSGKSFTVYLTALWSAIQVVGGLLVIFYFIWGAIDWIGSHGEKSKYEAARNKMTQAVVGFLILISTFTIVGYVGKLIGFDFLNPVFLEPGDTINQGAQKDMDNSAGNTGKSK